MNNNIIKGLIGLCVLLLLALFIEWQLTDFPEQAQIEPSGLEKGEASAIDLPKLILVTESEEKYSKMVDKPLFVKGRRPIVSDLEDEVVNEDVGKIDDLLLLGIYSNKGDTKALFSAKGIRKKYLKKAEEEDVSGWKIKEIKPDRVILEQRGKKKTILLRSPKPKTKRKIKPKTIKRNNQILDKIRLKP